MRALLTILIDSLLLAHSVIAFEHLVEIRLPSKSQETRYSKRTSRSPLQEFLEGKAGVQNHDLKVQKSEPEEDRKQQIGASNAIEHTKSSKLKNFPGLLMRTIPNSVEKQRALMSFRRRGIVPDSVECQ